MRRRNLVRGISRLYFGAADEKGGAVEHGVRFFAQPTCHHAPEIYGGIAESKSAVLLREFFKSRRRDPAPALTRELWRMIIQGEYACVHFGGKCSGNY